MNGGRVQSALVAQPQRELVQWPRGHSASVRQVHRLLVQRGPKGLDAQSAEVRHWTQTLGVASTAQMGSAGSEQSELITQGIRCPPSVKIASMGKAASVDEAPSSKSGRRVEHAPASASTIKATARSISNP